MAVQAGGGAATIAGVRYQSAVAAYFVVSLLCDLDTELFGQIRLSTISFETANPIDDINVTLASGETSYLQAKRRLSFSLSPKDDLYSCFDQFVRQWRSTDKIHSLVLVTTSESSRRITINLAAIVAALQSGTESDLRRDQNKSLVRDFDLIMSTLKSIRTSEASMPPTHDEALALLKRMRVCVLDLATGSPIEQAAHIVLSAKRCTSPALFWGNLIADCGSFGASRRSVGATFIKERYSRYFSDSEPAKSDDKPSIATFFKSVLSGPVSTGREIVIGTVDAAGSTFPEGEGALCIFEFYRFDNDCDERLVFQNQQCILQNGLRINLLGRMATYQGLNRFLERKKEILESATKVVHFPANLPDDPDESACAIARRELLEQSIDEDGNPIECIRCGLPISSNDVDYIEYSTSNGSPRIGLTHHNCTLADDRIIGTIHSDFFKKYGFLRNFDAVTWFNKIARGQGAYMAKAVLKGTIPLMTWSGRSATAGGSHIVEFELEGGTSEFSYHRGQLDRFSKQKATKYCLEMNQWIASQAEKGDPLCISEETMQFGARSTLHTTVGVREKLRPILRAQEKHFSSRIARRYDIRDSWYAPVAYLRSLPDETPVGFFSSIFLISEPLFVDRYLSNWQDCGLELTDYDVPIISSDDEFDQFARDKFNDGFHFLIDPLFTAGGELTMLSGAQLVSLDILKASLKA